jgi:hypothetical protein
MMYKTERLGYKNPCFPVALLAYRSSTSTRMERERLRILEGSPEENV